MGDVGLVIKDGFILVSVPFYDGALIFAVSFWLTSFVVRLVLSFIKALPGL